MWQENDQACLLFRPREATQAERISNKEIDVSLMSDLKNILFIIIGAFILIILWAITIGFTYWDAASRRKLPGIETAAWVGLVALIPGVGFAAYLFARLLGNALSPNHPFVENPRRGTMIKRHFEHDQRTGTISAADFLQPDPTQKNWPEMKKEGWKFTISIVAGPNTGEEYILKNFPVKIGRGPEVYVRLDGDQGVSRLHAEIYEQIGVLRIRDLSSTHGTRVNEFSITDKSLDPGDLIRVGKSILKVGVQEKPV